MMTMTSIRIRGYLLPRHSLLLQVQLATNRWQLFGLAFGHGSGSCLVWHLDMAGTGFPVINPATTAAPISTTTI